MKLKNNMKVHEALVLLREIPCGKVVTYKELARICGTSPRAIGALMRGNKDPVNFPCYKVVASNGALTGYSADGGINKKRDLLKSDEVRFCDNGNVSTDSFFKF
jgi:methylated-DNA-[protein]-cysteine S-methyltransferase